MTQRGLAPIEAIIEEARNGRMYILVDDEDRENEGDLIIPAQMATPDAINFMARYGRGLICLALTRSRSDELALQPMSRRNGCAHGTAFTVSIEARHGVSTGISAIDRAMTVAAAINAPDGRAAITTPGHVFPLVARDGGVLMRAGHTEAAVDISRLAGLNPSGVICEIMKDDGTMARLPDILEFADTHGMKVGAIRDLIAFRLKEDQNLERGPEAPFVSKYGGEWVAKTFRNKIIDSEILALVKGPIDPAQPTLVRMHALDGFTDILGVEGPRGDLLQRAMREIAEHGAGVIVVLTQQMPNLLTRLVGEKSEGTRQTEGLDVLRDYGVGAQILSALGIRDMILMTNSPGTLAALEGFGLNVVERVPLRSTSSQGPC